MKIFNSSLKEESRIPTMEAATSAMKKGQFEEARGLFAQMLEDRSQSDEAWVGLAHIHRFQSNKDLARACLLRGLDENPYNRTAIMNLYEWTREDGVDINKALFNKYLDRHPEDRNTLKFIEGSK